MNAASIHLRQRAKQVQDLARNGQDALALNEIEYASSQFALAAIEATHIVNALRGAEAVAQQ